MSSTGRSSPGATPAPRQTELPNSSAASRAAPVSRHSGGIDGRGSGPSGTPTSAFLPPSGDSHNVDLVRAVRRIAAAMRAVTIRDGQIVVAEHPDPEPQDGQLLVRVRAAG